jgi:hypothetical protein
MLVGDGCGSEGEEKEQNIGMVLELMENMLEVDPLKISNKIMHNDSIVEWFLENMKDI